MTDSVKERPDAVPCATCGTPTWSATRLCMRCRRGGVEPPPLPPPPPTDEELIGRREVVVDDEGRIAEDIACRACGYNLRGLTETATCPECSIPVGRSIQGDLLRFCDPAWVERVARGLKVILIGIVAGLLSGVALWVFMFTSASAGAGFSGIAMTVASAASVATSAIVVWGVWLATAPDPGHLGSERTFSARRLARWCVVAQLGSEPIQVLTNSGGMMVGGGAGGLGGFGLLTLLFGLVFGIVVAVGYAAGLMHLGRLLRRVPRLSLERQTRIVMWGFLACQVVTATFAVGMVLAMPALMGGGGGPGGRPGVLIAVLGLAGCATGVGSVTFGVWGLVLLIMSRSIFRRVAGEARLIWNASS